MNLYLLVIILKNPIFYKNGVINIETELLMLKIEGQIAVILFNILLLEKDKAVLGIF